MRILELDHVILIIKICGILVIADDLQFTLVANSLNWLQRDQAQLFTLPDSVNSTYNNSSHHIYPGTFIIYGGRSDLDTINKNDLWISANNGTSWSLINDTHSISYPIVPSCTWCSDPITHRQYAISRSVYNNTSIWTSTVQNLNTWTAIKPRVISTSNNISSPFLNRDGASCLVDSHSNIYYFLGINRSYTLAESYLYSDVWKSADHGHHWVLQTQSIPLIPRYKSVTGVHLNNTHLGGADIIYVLGGITIDHKGYEEHLNDIWVSSNSGVSWSQVKTQSSFGTGRMLSYQFSLYITRNGILILSTFGINTSQYSELWSSFDGGYHWVRCYGNSAYRDRARPSLTTDSDGYLYVMGGRSGSGSPRYHNDIWKSTISTYHLDMFARACGTTIPKAGVGLTHWPESNISYPSSSSSTATWGSSSISASSPSSPTATWSSSSSSTSSSSSSRRPSSSTGPISRSSSLPVPDWSSSSATSTPSVDTEDLTAWMGLMAALILLFSLLSIVIYFRYIKGKYNQIRWRCCLYPSANGTISDRLLQESELQ
jgi:hypothetical protein